MNTCWFFLPMFLPPYNLLCWAVAVPWYYLSGAAEKDYSGDTFLSAVIGAPVVPVALVYEWYWQRRDRHQNSGRDSG